MANLSAVQLNIHPPKAEIGGLNWQYWLTSVYSTFLDRNAGIYDFRLVRTGQQLKNNPPENTCITPEQEQDYDQLACVVDHLKIVFLNLTSLQSNPDCDWMKEGTI